MKVCVIGSGYVGLVSAACFAETGNDVVCADIDSQKVARLRAGEIPIHEPGLEPLVARNLLAGRLQFTTEVGAAVAASEVVFIAVGTPGRPDGGADLSAVDAVARTIARSVGRPTVVALKSTVPVGTNERVRRLLRDAGHPVHVVSNPEFLKEGAAIEDFMRPDRIVVGCDPHDEMARRVMQRLYHPVTRARGHIVWMDPASAELTKYVSNTMLAMRISFMNEVAALCERVGADVHSVRKGVGTDERIGPRFLYAGPGYGGSCFPKDVRALAQTARDHGVRLELAEATDRVNEDRRKALARKVREYFAGDVRGRRVAIWGVAFKPRTDDIRESPALTTIDLLLADGAEIVAYDPEAGANLRARYGDRVAIVPDPYDAAEDADALVLITEWRELQNPDFARIAGAMRGRLLLDGRNIWSSFDLHRLGFEYRSLGGRAAPAHPAVLADAAE